MNTEKLDKAIEILQALRDGKRVMAEINNMDMDIEMKNGGICSHLRGFTGAELKQIHFGWFFSYPEHFYIIEEQKCL